MNLNYGDDVHFMNAVRSSNGILPILFERFHNWSHKFLHYYTALLLLKTQVGIQVFKIINILLIFLLIECTIKITFPSCKMKYSFVAFFLFLTIPVQMINDCGWLVCSTFYLWPIATIMPSLLVVKHIITNAYISKFFKILSIVLCIYGFQSEQLCLFGFVFILIMIGYLKFNQKKKINSFFYIILSIAIFNLILLIICPGNRNRFVIEEKTWFSGFSKIPLTRKIIQGFLSTMSYYFGMNDVGHRGVSSYSNFILLITVCLLATLGLIRRKKYIFLLLPPSLVLIITFGYLPIILQRLGVSLSPFLYLFKNNTLPSFSYYSKNEIFIELIIYAIVFITLCLTIFLSFSCRIKSLLVTLVFIAGFCTRMLLSFSPTIYASQYRTFLYMTISIIIVNLYLFNEIISENDFVFFKILIIIQVLSIAVFLFPKKKFYPTFPVEKTNLPNYQLMIEYDKVRNLG